MTDLVDTNILVYRFDPREPRKQQIATDFLRAGIVEGSFRVPHQAILEFVAALRAHGGLSRVGAFADRSALRLQPFSPRVSRLVQPASRSIPA